MKEREIGRVRSKRTMQAQAEYRHTDRQTDRQTDRLIERDIQIQINEY